MKGMVVSFAIFALLLAPIAATGLASAAGQDRTDVVVDQGSTDRFGGGEWVSVRSGDARVAVLYGTPAHPNRIVVFAEYKRYLGGAEIYDEQGNYLGRRGIPVFTVFGQSLDGLVEFQDTNGDGLLNFRTLNATDVSDTPVKLIGLRHLGWTLSGLTQTNVTGTTYVNFTVSAESVPYDLVWSSAFPRRGIPTDGSVGRIGFTFHLTVNVHEITAEVPWFRVTVSSSATHEITAVERLANHTLSGSAVAMGAKYDHAVDGWDFADAANKLALENGLLYGNYIPERVVDFIHKAFYHSTVSDQDRFHRGENVPTEDRPTLITRDHVYLADSWERVGRYVWVSDVIVDGMTQPLVFQVQGGRPDTWTHGGAVFVGFHLRAAFIYPAGQSIVHDPAIDAVVASYSIGTVANLTPLTVLALQLLIAGVAIGPALWLRAKGRTPR